MKQKLYKTNTPEILGKAIFFSLISALVMSVSMGMFNTMAYYKNLPNFQSKIGFIQNHTLRKIISNVIEITPTRYNTTPLGSHNYRWFVFNIIILLLMLAFRKKIVRKIAKVASEFWDKKSILFFITFILFTFFSNVFWGGWFSGIRGWDERQSLQEKIAISKSHKKEFNFLLKGINQENMKKYIGIHCLDGEVILGYTATKTFALNEGVTSIVFPSRFHDYKKIKWLQIVNYRLQKIRREQKLGLSFLYPEHAMYNKLPEIPDSNLCRIEYWNVRVCNNGKEIYISDAKLKRKYD